MVSVVKLTIDIDTVDLEPNETLTVHIGGEGSWTSIVVEGNGVVALAEQGRERVSVNLKELARYLGYQK